MRRGRPRRANNSQFAAEVVFTSANWRRTQLASGCPPSGSLEIHELQSVDTPPAVTETSVSYLEALTQRLRRRNKSVSSDRNQSNKWRLTDRIRSHRPSARGRVYTCAEECALRHANLAGRSMLVNVPEHQNGSARVVVVSFNSLPRARP